MPPIEVNCICVGEPSRDGVVGFIFRVDGFKDDILVKGFTGTIGYIHFLSFLN